MANLKNAFTKGIATINVKTNNFMEETKCKTYITTLENEIKELKFQIGNKVYEKWAVQEEFVEEIEGTLQQIAEKYQEIQTQEARMQQLHKEEQQILGNAQKLPEGENTVFCSQCGMQNAPNYKFCCKCGVALK